MENQMTSLKCRKCGATVTADQKKCPKCNAPILLKVMMEEEKRHLPAKEIREKDKRMRQEYAKMNKEKELERQKAEKKSKQLQEKAEKKREREKAELAAIRAKEEKKAKSAKEKEEKLQAKKEAFEAKKAKKATKTEPKSAETKGKSPVIAGILIGIAVLAVIAAAVFFLNRPANNEPVAEPEIEEVTEEVPAEEPVAEEPVAEVPAEVPEEVQPEPEKPAPQKEPETPKEPAPKRNITRNNYLFPSDSQYLTEADLNGLSKFDTGLIRNEIYAKKGYVFKDEPYKSYFNSQAWYNPNPSAKMRLNEIEKYNVEFLLEYERSQGWR